MLAQPYSLTIERRDTTRNMARFYSLAIEEDLFGTPCLVRRWGRIGTHGQAKRHPCADEGERWRCSLSLAAVKRRRGYAPRAVTTG